jgi:hypothetical protein
VLSQIFDKEFLDEYIESQQPFEEQVYAAGQLISMRGS